MHMLYHVGVASYRLFEHGQMFEVHTANELRSVLLGFLERLRQMGSQFELVH